ncbi:MAG TPA: hypothetical protein DDZ62_16305 [Delftia acidovorans]|nr:hypothetical protein [Delftia acidovorans]
MSDPANPTNAFTPSADIYKGISVLSSEDWIGLTTFFESAVTDNPTTTELMRAMLGMQKQDAFRPEFSEAVELFVTLKGVGQKFKADVQDKMLTLADDIVQYNDVAATTYERLIELVDRFDLEGAPTPSAEPAVEAKWKALVKVWESDTPSGRSEQIKRNFSSALEQLIEDANARSVRAFALQNSILDNGNGILMRLNACKTAFNGQKQKFTTTLGAEGAANQKLKAAVEKLENDLKALRRKEKDEVIVLSTSPAYLAIPLFGPLILAGVDIGVGADLAVTRRKIAEKVDEVRTIQATMATNERFIGYYNRSNDRFDSISKSIEDLGPKLKTLGEAWRAISADLGNIHKVLSTTGRKSLQGENWFSLTVVLGTAKKGWARVAGQADHFRRFGGTPKKAQSVDQLVELASKKAA